MITRISCQNIIRKNTGGGYEPPKLNDKKTKYYIRGKEIADIIGRNYKGTQMSVFEKGCGWGINLLCVKERFPMAELYTDEPDEHTTEVLQYIGVKRIAQDKKFDVIIMSHVLEHLLNPVSEIQWAYEHLASKGLLYVEVPNSMNFAEPHVTFWAKDALLYFFHNAFVNEFEIVECYTTGYPYYVMKNGPYKIKYKNWKVMQKIIPASRMQNRKMENGVYLKILLRSKK